jgi:hypothetical protein
VKRRISAWPWLAAGLLMVLAGCQESGPRRYAVSGTVRFEGQPVATGEIRFSPASGAGRPDSALIADGKYSFRVTDGEKAVMIFATSTDPELVGPPPPDMPPGGINPAREYLPERYNVATELKATVEPKNHQVFGFDLERCP